MDQRDRSPCTTSLRARGPTRQLSWSFEQPGLGLQHARDGTLAQSPELRFGLSQRRYQQSHLEPSWDPVAAGNVVQQMTFAAPAPDLVGKPMLLDVDDLMAFST